MYLGISINKIMSSFIPRLSTLVYQVFIIEDLFKFLTGRITYEFKGHENTWGGGGGVWERG